MDDPVPFQNRRHHHGWLALILIFLGVLLLLQNLGLVSSVIWSQIFALWPLVLIMMGLEMILGDHWLGKLVLTLFGILIILLIIALAIFQKDPTFLSRFF